MAKSFDPKVLTAAIIEVVEGGISEKNPLPPTQPSVAEAKEIVEYEGCMRVSGMGTFDSPCYIAAVSLYANAGDMQRNKAKGALVLYMSTEYADKIFKSLGYTIPYDEDDESMLKLTSDFCQAVSKGVIAKLSAKGFAELTASSPVVAKNTLADGVAFSNDQHEKQEVVFTYFKSKAIVVDVTLAEISRK